VLLLAGSRCGADETEADRSLREQWQGAYQAIAESIQMRRGEKPLSLHKSPLLFYTNPVRQNDQHGSIFLWTDEGRPAVFGSIWSGVTRLDQPNRNVTHEWHSLMADEVQAVRGNAILWVSGEPGIAWQTLADLPTLATTRSGRLVQMRGIARRVTAGITEDGKETELRLMSQPLYRYPETASGAFDGALFVYSLATDPELILLVEAQSNAGEPAYRLALARFGNLAMDVRDGQRIIWSCQRGTPGRSEGRYYLRWRAEQMPAEPAASK
jgi:hypothetical protein